MINSLPIKYLISRLKIYQLTKVINKFYKKTKLEFIFKKELKDNLIQLTKNPKTLIKNNKNLIYSLKFKMKKQLQISQKQIDLLKTQLPI